MQPSQGQKAQPPADVVSGEFFVPDLCAPRPVFVMVMLMELLVLVYILASSTLPRFDWNLLATSSLFVQWTALLSAAFLCLSRGLFSRASLSLAATGSMLIILAVTAFSSYLAIWLYPQLTSSGLDRREGGDWWLLRNIAIASVLAGIALRYFYLQQQLRLREKSELQARLDSLRSRIRPHFLFNTMNSIASLIASQPDAAERAVEDLSELFRSSLQENDRISTVADELRLCELYLDIEKLRLGERLTVDWNVDSAMREKAMPGLILQPLVENAVYHGISQLPDGGTITVIVNQAGDSLRARIENPIPDYSTHSQGHHMALDNIEQRLHGLFGPEAHMEATRGDGHYYVELTYPLDRMT